MTPSTSSTRWNLVAALDGNSCVLDEWAPEDGVYPQRAHLDCDYIAAAMRRAGAVPQHWYVVRVDLEPDGTVVGEAYITLAGIPSVEGSLMPAPTGMIESGGWKTGHVTARGFEIEGSPKGNHEEVQDLDLEPSSSTDYSFAISQGFEKGNPGDFVSAPALPPGDVWERRSAGPEVGFHVEMLGDGWVRVSKTVSEVRLEGETEGRPWTEADLASLQAGMLGDGRPELTLHGKKVVS